MAAVPSKEIRQLDEAIGINRMNLYPYTWPPMGEMGRTRF